MNYLANATLVNKVPSAKQGGKPPKLGSTPYQVAVFQPIYWEHLTKLSGKEAHLCANKAIVARFNTYGDAYAYAVRLRDSKSYAVVLIYTPGSILDEME